MPVRTVIPRGVVSTSDSESSPSDHTEEHLDWKVPGLWPCTPFLVLVERSVLFRCEKGGVDQWLLQLASVNGLASVARDETARYRSRKWIIHQLEPDFRVP